MPRHLRGALKADFHRGVHAGFQPWRAGDDEQSCAAAELPIRIRMISTAVVHLEIARGDPADV